MKKHIVAVAVAAAVATPVMAQNVTVYGIMDRAFANQDVGSTTNATKSVTVGDVLSSSRLGFKGSEDLGGGMKAVFQAESALADAQAVTTARATFVGIEGSFGGVYLGQRDIDVTNIDDKVSQFGNFSANPVDANTASEITLDSLGNDTGKGIHYVSPKFNGLSFSLGYQSADVTEATASVGNKVGGVVSYENGPLQVHYGTVTQDGNSGNAEKSLTQIAAAYDFGIASVGINNMKADGDDGSENKVTATTISIKIPLGNGLAVGGYYGRYKDDTVAVIQNKAKGTGLIITKDLSKRTTVYAAYASVTNEANANFQNRGMSVNGTVAEDPKTAMVGVRHSF